jgi:hypothetical protein
MQHIQTLFEPRKRHSIPERAAGVVARRFRLSLHHARVVVELAQIGGAR